MSDASEIPGPSSVKRKVSEPDERHVVRKRAFEGNASSNCDSHSEESRTQQSAIDEDSATKLGDYLSSEYGVLRRVLSSLPALSLRRCAQVCRSWRSAARIVCDSRSQFHWLFWRANNGGWNIPPPLAVFSNICEHVYSQPTICIAFFSKTAMKKFECSSPGVLCPVSKQEVPCGKLHQMESFMSTAMGPHCEMLSFPVSGVIGCSQDLQSTFEVENKRGVQAMSACLIPNIPGVKVVPFHLTKADLLKLLRSQRDEAVVVEMLGLPKEMLVQAVIIFSGYRIRGSETHCLVAALQARQRHKIAVGGGVTDNADGMKGLVFLGDNVCAASVIVPESVTEKEQFSEKILELKKCNLPVERTLCFMFACLGRGIIWYDGEQNIESSIINKIFPTSPIIGFFGRGEIGVNSLPVNNSCNESREFWQDWNTRCNDVKGSLDEPSNNTNSGSEYSLDHSYSTSIVFLSFNSKVKHDKLNAE